ncbi:MAG: hypothetical protein QME90_10105, partial [Thermodesulfobacteriota bacterium]|nr:hypothetical protein [Thermodesulfobacteriota bacterium]
WIPAGVYPDENRGRNDRKQPFQTFYETINLNFVPITQISFILSPLRPSITFIPKDTLDENITPEKHLDKKLNLWFKSFQLNQLK